MARLLASVDELLALVSDAAARAPADVARAAVFDADGTLWRGDIGDTAFHAAADAGMIDDATWRGALREWARRWQLELPEDPRAGAAHILGAAQAGELAESARRRGLDDGIWRAELYAMQAWAYAGRSRAQIEAFGASLFAAGFGDGVFTQMRSLLAGLSALGLEVWIASASHGALVAAGASWLGLAPARALGMEPALDEHGVTLPALAISTYGPGKAAVAERALGGRRPLAAFGDSVLTTDRELLELAVLPVAIASSGAHRQAALEHPRIALFDPHH